MENIEKSLIKTIAESDLSSIAGDVAELGFDSMLDEGLLRDLPVFSKLASLYRTGCAIKNYLYLKKLYRFLGPLKNIPKSERAEYIVRLGRDDKERVQTGENLLLIIDRFSNIKKPEILGKIFRDFLLGDLSKSDFMRLARALELFDLELSKNLASYYYKGSSSSNLINGDILQSFAIFGLIGMNFDSRGILIQSGGYRKNNLGKLFVKYI